MNEVDKILLRQYRRDLFPIWTGIGEISEKVVPTEDIAKGFAEIETKGEFNMMKDFGPEVVALWEMGAGICHAVVEIERLLGIEEDDE